MAALAAACADPRWQSAVVGEDSWLGAPRALLMLGRMLLAAGCPADAVRRVTAMEDNTVPITAAWVVSLNFHLPKTYVPGDTPARRVHRPALRRAVAALLEVAVKHMRAAPDELEALARAALPRIRDDVVGHAEAFLVAGVMIGDALAHRRGMRAVGHLPRTQADLFVSRLRPFHLASSSLRGFSPTFTEEALGTVVHIGHAAEAAVWHLESYGRSNWTTLIGTSAAAAAAGGAPPAAAVARTIAMNRGKVRAAEADGAGRWRDQVEDHACERRLAGARLADDGEDLRPCRLESEADVVDRIEGARAEQPAERVAPGDAVDCEEVAAHRRAPSA
jgi:hypothetical protein